MASSTNIVLRKKQRKDGTYPLALRITKDRKSSFIYLGKYIAESDWDADKQRIKKTHVNATRLNNFLIKKLADLSNAALELEGHRNEVSSQAVKLKAKPTSTSSFFEQAEIYLTQLKETGKYNQYTADKSRIASFKTFRNNQDIILQEITESLLRSFRHYLQVKHTFPSNKTIIVKRATTKKPAETVSKLDTPLSERSIINHYVVIRSVFSMAIKGGVVDARYYPFGKGKIAIRFPETNKIGLSIEDIKRIEEATLENPNHNHARNLWLTSFYLGGMRASDVFRLKWSDFKDNRLHYTMGKNAKTGSLKTPEKLLSILAQYEEQKTHTDDFIFPELKSHINLSNKFAMQRTIGFATSRNDKFLRLHVAPAAGVLHTLTMHIARHSFGNIAGDKIALPMLQKIFRHSNITTTMMYMANFMNKETDEALDSVIGF